MHRGLAVGLVHAGIVFVIGFALGTARTLFVAPRTGDKPALALELPLMLAASWAACRQLARRGSPRLAPRLVMGGTAFAALVTIEFAVSVGLFGGSPAAWLAAFTTPTGGLGLVGRIGFAAMPLLVGRTDDETVAPPPE